MTTTGSRRSLHVWALCLALLGAMPGRAQAGGALFIQGSEVNLRDKPAANAKVVAKVTIGTGCQHVKDAPKQWVRIKCGDAEGFTLKSLVGAERPSAEALLAQAQDDKLAAKVRLDAAMRAATLDPKNEQALKVLAERFFDVNFEQLYKDQKKGGLHELFRVLRAKDATGKLETGEAGVLRELEKIEFDWHRFELRGNDFVSAMYRGGALVVYAGDYESMNELYKLQDHEPEFRLTIDSRSSSEVSDVLKLALQQGARTPREDPAKYNPHQAEFPGMPILSPTAFRLLRSLPVRWHYLAEEYGERFIRDTCGWVHTKEIRFDLHRRALIQVGDSDIELGDDFGESFAESSTHRVADVTRKGSTYTFLLRTDTGKDYTQTLEWPTKIPGVGVWSQAGDVPSDLRPYAAGRPRTIEVREQCNSQ